jgi:methionyl-tRNA formyltransferase
MNKIDVYLCGHKGAACAEIIAKKYADYINVAIVENDTTLKDSPYSEMLNVLQSAGIKVLGKAGKELADVAIAVGWRKLIREDYKQLVVLHDSLLPKYRGFNPLLTALNNSDRFIGVTALLGNSEMDSGPIILQKKASISYPIRLAKAVDIVAKLSGEIVSKIISDLISGKKLKGKKQDESKATYSIWRDEKDFRIKWEQSAAKIIRHIDSSSAPYAGASALLDGQLVKIERATVAKIKSKIINPTPGKIWKLVDGAPLVLTGSGFIKITEMTDAAGKSLLPLTKLKQRFE